MNLLFYDFEVFKYDWLVVIINPSTEEKNIIINDKDKLSEFYEQHKTDIWVGYNSRRYDQFILKGILSGFDPYKISTYIIDKDKSGYFFNRKMNEIPFYNYDAFVNNSGSLKTLEAFMGNDIKETEVPFDIDRKLTAEEINETVKYCTHDVEQLIEVFLIRKEDFNTHINLIKEFNLPLDNINKTSAQLISVILGAKKQERNDEFEISIPPTLKLNKYKFIADWFLHSYDEVNAGLINKYNQARNTLENSCSKTELRKAQEYVSKYENGSALKEAFYANKLDVDVAGCPHTFAWGGVHGALSQFNYVCKPDELLVMADVSSLYPSIMIQYDLLSRSVKDKDRFKEIYDTNLEMKKNKDPRRPIYKLICNMTYGSMGDVYNAMHDQRNRNLVCVYGQLLLLDLIEKLEPHCKLIQSNTDGILILIKRKDFDRIDDIIYEWEHRTRLNMEVDFYKKAIQKDVNNYVLVGATGKVKTKGGYVKKLSDLDYDLPVINKAILDYLVSDTPVETTINACNELIMFQKIIKLTKNYDHVEHNGVTYHWKSYRVFASKNTEDSIIYKCKPGKKDKFANTPEKCFIENGRVAGVSCPDKLDKQWYIDLAKERLKQFGV